MKTTNPAVEAEIHHVFRDRSKTVSERAKEGLTLLTSKLTDDIIAQKSRVHELRSSGRASYADAEIAKLLRMLEKRRKLMERLEALLTPQ